MATAHHLPPNPCACPAAEGYSAAIARCGPGQEHIARGLAELLQVMRGWGMGMGMAWHAHGCGREVFGAGLAW